MTSGIVSLVKSVPGASWVRSLFDYRMTKLCRRRLETEVFQAMVDDAGFNSVIDDLAVYTGLAAPELKSRLLRTPRTHFESEFRWHNPKSFEELTWFYRCSYGYLFANAAHSYWPKLDILKPSGGLVLDYGAGIGCNTIELARRGFKVDHFEIGIIQADFARFRAARRNLQNLRVLTPFVDGKFDPINSIQDEYYAIVAMDVLEHIPDYHLLLKHLIGRLKPGGYIIEKSPFDDAAGPISIHLPASVPLNVAMVGMRQLELGVWQKVADSV